jgi:hypothetical protein
LVGGCYRHGFFCLLLRCHLGLRLSLGWGLRWHKALLWVGGG